MCRVWKSLKIFLFVYWSCLTWKTMYYHDCFGVYFCLVYESQIQFFTLKNMIMTPRKLFPPEKVSLPYLHA